jgi:flagellar biosynthetic protein FliR
MDLLLQNPYNYLDTFLLVFVRALSLFMIVPIYSNRNIPRMVKVALAFFISTIIINIVTLSSPVPSTDIIGFGIIVIKEVFVGWTIGLGAYIAFSIMALAGQFIDYQIGFSMVNVFDPLSQIQFTITGTLYYYLLLLITLVTNAHYYLFKAIALSYKLIPLGSVSLSISLYNSFISFFNEFIVIALQIASPIFFVMLITNVVLGILARTVPQLNMFVIGFPLKILLGLAVIFITLNLFPTISEVVIDKMMNYVDILIKGMMPL